MNLTFLGRGWSFPPTFNLAINGVEMREQEDDIASSLEILLTTMPGERVMLPDFGCNMAELIFENLDTTTKTLLADKIESAILYYEPRIDLEKVTLNTARELEGVVLIEITYRVRATNSRFNFVFPFYKQEGTDINLTTTLNVLPDSN
ncbi:GPW/gp25 family protein [Spirosoma sp.]|uniref:GPW/gp25 family protein n=1 Tax=Spirosoma sp. TaxID=1899569 RepID=UPI0026122BE9|nr:GPW/gp25 family protein [Spirosoma sp.]MCX6218597.1 GPW/gp25 family protein [Spirosoma sp.]